MKGKAATKKNRRGGGETPVVYFGSDLIEVTLRLEEGKYQKQTTAAAICYKRIELNGATSHTVDQWRRFGVALVATANNNNKSESDDPNNNTNNTSRRHLLSSLKINNCLLGDSEIIQLVHPFYNYDQMVELDLSNNMIGNNGAVALSNSIITAKAHKVMLKTLVLNGNMIEDDGCIAMSDALKTNKYLHTLNLSNNNYGLKGLESIRNVLQGNNTTLTAMTYVNDLWTPKAETCYVDIEYYLLLNKSGRKFFREDDDDDYDDNYNKEYFDPSTTTISLIPYALHRVRNKHNIIFGLILELPHLWKCTKT